HGGAEGADGGQGLTYVLGATQHAVGNEGDDTGRQTQAAHRDQEQEQGGGDAAQGVRRGELQRRSHHGLGQGVEEGDDGSDAQGYPVARREGQGSATDGGNATADRCRAQGAVLIAHALQQATEGGPEDDAQGAAAQHQHAVLHADSGRV